ASRGYAGRSHGGVGRAAVQPRVPGAAARARPRRLRASTPGRGWSFGGGTPGRFRSGARPPSRRVGTMERGDAHSPGNRAESLERRHGLGVLESGRPFETVTRLGSGGPRRLGGLVAYRSSTLDGERTLLHGIPITT